MNYQLTEKITPEPKHKTMTEVNSAESYYQYKAESDSKIKSKSDEISRLNNELKEMKLQSAIEKQIRDPDVSSLIFNLTKGSATEIDNEFKIGDLPLDRAIDSIRSNDSLKRFFSGADIPIPEPKRVYKQWFD